MISLRYLSHTGAFWLPVIGAIAACGGGTSGAIRLRIPVDERACGVEQSGVDIDRARCNDCGGNGSERHDVQPKIVFMKTQVTPATKADFVAFNAKYDGTFACSTCHGKDGKERQFKMPSNDLPKLPADMQSFSKTSPKSANSWLKPSTTTWRTCWANSTTIPRPKQGFPVSDATANSDLIRGG